MFFDWHGRFSEDAMGTTWEPFGDGKTRLKSENALRSMNGALPRVRQVQRSGKKQTSGDQEGVAKHVAKIQEALARMSQPCWETKHIQPSTIHLKKLEEAAFQLN